MNFIIKKGCLKCHKHAGKGNKSRYGGLDSSTEGVKSNQKPTANKQQRAKAISKWAAAGFTVGAGQQTGSVHLKWVMAAYKSVVAA
jgi:hypothetical protein